MLVTENSCVIRSVVQVRDVIRRDVLGSRVVEFKL